MPSQTSFCQDCEGDNGGVFDGGSYTIQCIVGASRSDRTYFDHLFRALVRTVMILICSQRAAIHAKRLTIMKNDSSFILDLWHTIDKDCAIGRYDEASAAIIGRRKAKRTLARRAHRAKCRQQVAEKKLEGLKPIVKNGLIRGWRPRQDDEASDDDLFSERYLQEGE